MLLNYVATYSNKCIVYRASDMVLCTHADAGYLNETKSHSRAGAHIYLSKDNPIPRFNSAVLTIATIIKLGWEICLEFCRVPIIPISDLLDSGIFIGIYFF
jgi:hypothetical protein